MLSGQSSESWWKSILNPNHYHLNVNESYHQEINGKIMSQFTMCPFSLPICHSVGKWNTDLKRQDLEDGIHRLGDDCWLPRAIKSFLQEEVTEMRSEDREGKSLLYGEKSKHHSQMNYFAKCKHSVQLFPMGTPSLDILKR